MPEALKTDATLVRGCSAAVWVYTAGTDAEKLAAFSHAFTLMNRRISLLTSLPDSKLQAQAIQQELKQIGALREQGL